MTWLRCVCVALALGSAISCNSAPEPARTQPDGASKDTPASAPSYSFTSDWFSNRIPQWSKNLATYAHKPGVRYLEVGVFEGRSLFWVLDNILTDPTAQAFAADTFYPVYEKQFLTNLAVSGSAGRVTLLKGRSRDTLRALHGASFDIIYIDGSHQAENVLTDAVLCWDLLRVGGMMIFDDYLFHAGQEGTRALPDDLRPQAPIDAFITAYRRRLEIVHREYQVFVRKRANPCDEVHYTQDRDPEGCSTFGTYVYYWGSRQLVEPRGEQPVTLLDGEEDLIEHIIKTRKPGDVNATSADGWIASPPFQALARRLRLDPTTL